MVSTNESVENTKVLKRNYDFGVSHLFRLKRFVQSTNSDFAGAEAIETSPKRRNVFKKLNVECELNLLQSVNY